MTPPAADSSHLPRNGAFLLALIVLVLDLAAKHWAATTLASPVHPLVLQAGDGASVRAALVGRGWSEAAVADAVRSGQVVRYQPVHGLDAAQTLAAGDLALDLIVLTDTGLIAPRRWRAAPQDLGHALADTLATAWRTDAAAVPALLQHAWRASGRIEDPATPLAQGELYAVRDHSIRVCPGFSLVYAENPGAAWSFLATSPPIVRFLLFVTISSIASLAMAAMLWRRRMGTPLSTWALAAILGGAVGNLADRVHYRAVVDFIYNFVIFDEGSFWGRTFGPGVHGWPVWNIADAGITVGVILIALDSLRQPKATPAPAS